MKKIPVKKAEKSRIDGVDWNNLRFGVYLSDHIFVADYYDGAWRDLRIEPYAPMPIEPANCTLHYGQTVFEGLKAFATEKNIVNLFRPYKNAKRLNHSGQRVCIPPFDEDTLVEAMIELIKIDKQWIPRQRGHSLYIRPVVFGSSNFLGVHSSSNFRLIVMTTPVGSYYPEGLNPIKILVASEYSRAVRGGLGSAKTAANYAASLLAGEQAKKMGFSQVLWLDAVSREFIDEVGAMNIMFVIGDELITPPLDHGTILDGVTRDTVLTLARSWGLNVSERHIKITDVLEAHKTGKLKEIFGTGTAAVISPVGMLSYRDSNIVINNMQIGPLAQRLYDTITGIQYGELEDIYDWNVKIEIKL